MATVDICIYDKFKDMVEDQGGLEIIRDLAPGTDQYRSVYHVAKGGKERIRKVAGGVE